LFMRITGVVALALFLSPSLGLRAAAEEGTGARALIDRAIAAAGGEARLGRFKAAEWTCKGTAHASTELTFTDHCFAQWPEQFRNESAFEAAGEKFERALILDSSQGWVKTGRSAVAMNDATRDEFRDKVHVLCLSATLLPLREKGVTLKALDEIQVDGRAAVGVSAAASGRPEVALYFDKEKSLLLKCERGVKDPLLGKVTEETYFSDYREAGGVQVARKVSVKRGGKPFLDWTVSDFRVRAKLDGGLFAAP
jgi:hypothetical protein